MAVNSRLILFSEGALYLAPDARYELAQTNLACYAPKIKSTEHRYLEVEGKYDKESGALEIQVCNHLPEDTSGFATQKVKASVKKINITGLQWSVLNAMIYTYQAGLRNAPFIIHDTPTPSNDASEVLHARSAAEKDTIGSAESGDNKDQTPSRPSSPNTLVANEEARHAHLNRTTGTFHETFDYPFGQVAFCDGYVVVEHKFRGHPETISLRITNDKLIASFGYIRGYFANVLRIGKTISVSASVELVEGEVIQSSATSIKVSAITDELLELVKQQRTEDIISSYARGDKKQTILTAGELLDNAPGGNVFAQSAEDVVRVILQRTDIRNKSQLQYLAADRHDAREKVRFTLEPDLGFLFYIESGPRFHFCWELLNSNATYLWSFDRGEYTVQAAVARLEAALSAIYTNGRKQYRSRYVTKQLDADLLFYAVHHAKEDLGEEASFDRWRNKIIALLV